MRNAARVQDPRLGCCSSGIYAADKLCDPSTICHWACGSISALWLLKAPSRSSAAVSEPPMLCHVNGQDYAVPYAGRPQQPSQTKFGSQAPSQAPSAFGQPAAFQQSGSSPQQAEANHPSSSFSTGQGAFGIPANPSSAFGSGSDNAAGTGFGSQLQQQQPAGAFGSSGTAPLPCKAPSICMLPRTIVPHLR